MLRNVLGGPPGALSGRRIVNLSGPEGWYATKQMADLGAEVIMVEPPGGHPARRIGPFWLDRPHPERSLYFFQMNTNKLSITLDFTNPDGHALLLSLLNQADVLVESYPPGTLSKLGLDYEALRRRNPALILTSITGFGQQGPFRDWQWSDLICCAMGGLVSITGEARRAPVRARVSHSFSVGSLFAGIATLSALQLREQTGAGQAIDVSLQASIASVLEYVTTTHEISGGIIPRNGNQHPTVSPNAVFPCRDGAVALVIITLDEWEALITWMKELGLSSPIFEDRWNNSELRLANIDFVKSEVTRFTRQLDRDYLYLEGQSRGIVICPVNSIQDLMEDKQLQGREFFVNFPHKELGGTATYLGAPYKFSRTPWMLRRRAPRIGEDNQTVYEDVGIDSERMCSLAQLGVI